MRMRADRLFQIQTRSSEDKAGIARHKRPTLQNLDCTRQRRNSEDCIRRREADSPGCTCSHLSAHLRKVHLKRQGTRYMLDSQLLQMCFPSNCCKSHSRQQT